LDFINISISFGSATKLTGEEDIHKLLKLAENRMYFLKLKEGKEAKLEMINYLKKRLEKITFETKAHYDRLKTIGMQIADKLNLTEIEKEELILLCEFHDIGKIGIPAEILQKTQSLNKEEWEDMKRHSEIGYNIIKESRETIAIDELILLHHENWDGSGYPGLFKSEEIPKVVRIFSIIDAYDAMINDRPYKKKMTTGDALKEIEAKAGSQFDPNIARTFIETMQDFRAS
jgi:HD-GYP domain-containing protein (c-di-GMP phosphodiesterase class II)